MHLEFLSFFPRLIGLEGDDMVEVTGCGCEITTGLLGISCLVTDDRDAFDASARNLLAEDDVRNAAMGLGILKDSLIDLLPG